MSPRFIFVSTLILAAAASRFIPHPPNFSPVGAIALFAGAQFADRRLAFAVPLIAMLICDLIVGLHVLIPVVYGSFALSVCLGMWTRKQPSATLTALAAFTSACLFFVITNFGSWLAYDTFPHTAGGLIACYIAGIPYFQNTLLSELFYTALLFGGAALAQARFPALREPSPAF